MGQRPGATPPTDTELSERDYPTQQTGFYSADPVFGDMLRAALRAGWKLVPCEHVFPERCVPEPDNPMSCDDERERGQARNLVNRILKSDPQARILVHAGNAVTSRPRFTPAPSRTVTIA